MKQSESAAREQWMLDAIAEIEAKAVDEPSERDAGAAAQYSFDKELAIEIIARHYAARARAVQELVKAAREQVCSIQCSHPDCNKLRAVLAPFAAKGETE